MDAFLIMMRNVLLFVALAVPGYMLVKFGLMKQEHTAAFSKLLMYVGLPFLLISSTINNLTFQKETLLTAGIVALLSTAYTVIAFFASKPLTAGEQNEKTRGMMRFCSVFSNNGFLGIPLALAVFGADSPVFMVLIVINIITNITMYTLGAYLVSGDKNSINFKKAFFSPVLIAFLIGVVLNLIKIKELLPEAVTYSAHFSNVVTPISMIVLGMKLGDTKFSTLFASKKTYYTSFLKLFVLPMAIVAVLLCLKAIPNSIVSNEMILGFFVAFSMPTAGLASTFADTYSGDTDSAVAFTLGTTLISILTIPVLYWLVCLIV